MDGGRRHLPSGNAQRRQFLPAEIGQQVSHGVNRQIKERRDDDQAKKEATDENLTALGPPFPQIQRYKSPNTITKSIEQEKHQSDRHTRKRCSGNGSRPYEKRNAKKNRKNHVQRKKGQLASADDRRCEPV